MRAIIKAKSRKTHFKLKYDSFKLDKHDIRVVIVWKSHINKKWQKQKLSLSLNKETFNAKM